MPQGPRGICGRGGEAVALTRETLQERLRQQLRQELVSGRFRAGEKIPEKELAAYFDVSRTPLREALARLEQEGLLISRPYTGYFFRTYSPAEIRGLLEVRVVLESTAARSAALQAGDDDIAGLAVLLAECERAANGDDLRTMVEANNAFHFEIARMSGNPWLPQILQTVQAHFGIVRLTSLGNPGRRLNIEREHRAICAAITARDAEAAARCMHSHLSHAADFLVGGLDLGQPPGSVPESAAS